MSTNLKSKMQQSPQKIGVEKDDAYQEEERTYPTQHAADLEQFITFMDGGFRSVYFIGQNLKGNEMKKFTGAIRRAQGTEDLYIWDNGLGEPGMKQLKDALHHNTVLQKLYIAKNDIKASSADIVGKMLIETTSLTELSLKMNKLEDKGVERIANALKENNSLRKLDLTSCHVADPGAKAIASALAYNGALKTLFLYKNFIGDPGAKSLGDAFKENSGLVRLDLKENKITDKGLRSLAKGLEENQSVSELYLDKNEGIGDQGAKDLLSSLAKNDTITRIQFGLGTQVSDNLKTEVQEKLKKNEEYQRDQYMQRLNATHKAPWRRSKLMVVGEGGAGKTATVRSLLNKTFDENWDSTVGVSITETNAHDVWTPDGKSGFAQTIAQRLAVISQAENKPAPKKPKRVVRKEQEEEEEEELEEDDNNDEEEEAPSGEKEQSGGEAGGESTEVVEEVQEQQGLDDNINLDDIDNDPLDKLYPFDATMVAKGRDEGEGVRMSIWDYGGQEVFYTLHHLFLTKYGVYLACFDMTKILKGDQGPIDFLKFWLNSIKFHAQEAPILMVGTFLDKLNKDKGDVEKVDKIIGNLVKSFPQVVRNDKDESNLCFFPINNKDKVGIVELRRNIEKVTVEQDFVDLEVSIQWMRALDIVLDAKSDWVTLNKMKAIGKKVGITSATEVDEMLKLFHELGVILHFTATVNLAEVVTTKPQWLVDAVSMVIRDPKLHPYDKKQFKNVGLLSDLNRLFSEGFASRDLLELLWRKEQVGFLLDLMRKLLLLSNWNFEDEKDTYLIPSMIVSEDKVSGEGSMLKFEFEFLPIGVFERLVCLAVDYSSSQENSPKPELSKEGSKVFFGAESPVTLYRQGDSIEILVSNVEEAPRVLDIFLAMMRKLDEDVMNGSVNTKTQLQDANGGFESLADARKKAIAPWFENKEKPAATSANFDNFLSNF